MVTERLQDWLTETHPETVQRRGKNNGDGARTLAQVDTRRHEVERARQQQEMRENRTLVVLLFGLGILALCIGLCTDLFSAGLGLVVLVGLWVTGFVAREYLGTAEYYDVADSELREDAR